MHSLEVPTIFGAFATGDNTPPSFQTLESSRVPSGAALLEEYLKAVFWRLAFAGYIA